MAGSSSSAPVSGVFSVLFLRLRLPDCSKGKCEQQLFSQRIAHKVTAYSAYAV